MKMILSSVILLAGSSVLQAADVSTKSATVAEPVVYDYSITILEQLKGFQQSDIGVVLGDEGAELSISSNDSESTMEFKFNGQGEQSIQIIANKPVLKEGRLYLVSARD